MRRAAVTTYEAIRVMFCCDEMKRQWGRLIGFGVEELRGVDQRYVNLFTDLAQANGNTVLEVTGDLGFARGAERRSNCA